MSDISNRVIIFSVFRPEFKGQNLSNHNEVLNALKQHGAIEVEGCYEGEIELSIMVPYNSTELYNLIFRSAQRFKQESILITNGDKTATIHYLNTGKIHNIGKLIATTELNAKKQKAYTYVPKMDTYFIARA